MSSFGRKGESEAGVRKGGNLDSDVVATKELDRLTARVVEPGEIIHLAVDGDVALQYKEEGKGRDQTIRHRR